MAISRRRDDLTLSTVTTLFLVAAASLLPHMLRAQITAEKIEFPAHPDSDLANAEPPLPLSGVIYYPGPPPYAAHSLSAVVLVHGCGGMWSNGNINAVNPSTHFALPGAPNLQTNIERWAIKIAQSGFVALALDSYTTRRLLPANILADPIEFQNQCASDVPWNGTVDPYIQRVFDIQAAYIHFTVARPEINLAKIVTVGWSQGAQATMTEAAETTRTGAARSSPTPFIRTVSIYPGCGSKLKFGPTSNTVANSYWRPHYPMHLHVGRGDNFYNECETRATKANALVPNIVTFPTIYTNAIHSYDNTQLSPIAEAWPGFECTTPMTGNECAMRSTDIDAYAFLEPFLV